MRRAANAPVITNTVVTVALAVGIAAVVAAAGTTWGTRLPVTLCTESALFQRCLPRTQRGTGAAGSVAPPGRVRAGSTAPYVGIWKAETSNVQLTLAAPIYFEFTAAGKSCAAYDTDPVYQCSAYDPYTAKGDAITVHQTGVSGNLWRYRWAVLPGGKLSLNSEVQLGGGQWVPLAKYTLVRATVTKPTPTPAAVKNDRTPPKVVSLTTSTQRDATGAIKATIRCRATDNVGLKDVTIGYREPGVKAGGLTWYGQPSTVDKNPKDQTWVSTFTADKTGTYTAICSATDKAKWSSGITEGPFVVNP